MADYWSVSWWSGRRKRAIYRQSGGRVYHLVNRLNYSWAFNVGSFDCRRFDWTAKRVRLGGGTDQWWYILPSYWLSLVAQGSLCSPPIGWVRSLSRNYGIPIFKKVVFLFFIVGYRERLIKIFHTFIQNNCAILYPTIGAIGARTAKTTCNAFSSSAD